MPHDVTMPQLGMAQDAGKIVAWLKQPGDAVTTGDALFEVETDKATMEVEAQASGYLTGVAAAEGDDVPVGSVIARISDSADAGDAEDASPAPAPAAQADGGGDDLPEGRAVTMPQLGMAQDSGVLVAWSVALGDKVGPDDTLFEVETDKSTMEVPAGTGGYLAATLAQDGDEVPVGQTVAILSDTPPATTLARGVAEAGPAPAPAPEPDPDPAPAATPAPAPAAKTAPAPAATGGRILASPKARRLAMEQGLDLARLAEAGHPQPFHVRDLEALRSLPDTAPASAPGPTAQPARRLVARTGGDGFAPFASWAAEAHGLTDPDALLAGLAAASLGAAHDTVIGIWRSGAMTCYAVPAGSGLAAATQTDTAPDLVLRDLRGSRITAVELGPEAQPVLTVTGGPEGLDLTLECAPASLDADAAIRLLTMFAERLEDPLRHLL